MESMMKEINEFMLNATEEQQAEVMRMFSNKNVHNRNMDKTEKFAEKLIKKENQKKNVYVKFLESNSVNGLIFAPTQVGKSAATREFIETCFKYNTPVIVSTDNKTDQQEQLMSRMERDLAGADVTMLKVSDKKFEQKIQKLIKEKNNRFVVFCLDNAVQIEKVIINLTSLHVRYSEMQLIKRIAIISDEADTVAKDADVENQHADQPESHKKWLELKDLINQKMGYLDLKRVFVTATPENVVMLYKVESPDVMKLEIPGTYVGYKDIKYKELEDDLDVKKVLIDEVSRIKANDTYEAILYCIDRKIVDGHDKVLESLSSILKCVVNTYNGNGITAFIRTVALCKKFETQLNRAGLQFINKGKYYQIKNLSIRKFYSIIKNIGERCVVTIGKDLICRGISYVGEDTINPITATTMIYKPGTTMNAVSICQTLGRVTGCAMPTLERTVYAPKDVIDTYIKYNRNQELYIDKITKTKTNILTKDIINEMTFEKYKRNIDRPRLNLKMNMSEVVNCNTERMKELVDMWLGANTIIGKVLNFVYHQNDVSEQELKSFIQSIGSSNIQAHYDECVRGGERGYNSVFTRSNGVTQLSESARMYIQSLEQ